MGVRTPLPRTQPPRRHWADRGLSHAGRASAQDELWLTAREVADLTGVSVVTVYSWACRGHLKVEGLDHRGQKLFRHIDVARAEKATRAKAKRVLVPAARPQAGYPGRT
ncbi:helix-turn-helix domain-containing protein [Streptomyces hirsutus]|uniref:helix-turn-helix domain-containing protein n=1 Tax=Streptomyces hirsutus TaxID=35620 RepID=UPI0036BDA472